MIQASVMKKLIAILFLAFCCATRAQTIIVVTVSSFQFSPANFVAKVGDIVRWNWSDGIHTTTSTTIPAGASPWNANMTSTSTQFDYVITASGTYNYVCVPHQAFGMVASFTVSAAATPVKLNSFSLRPAQNGDVLLSWQTLTEENADYFSVQRSENGKDFQEIGRVKAAGNSVLPLSYNFTDLTLNHSSRYLYYQLLVVDLDKKEDRSRIVLYKQDVKIKNIIVKISPNPVTSGDHLLIWFNADQNTKLQAVVYDVSGKRVYEDNMSAYPGVNFGHLHIHDLPAGAYLLKLSIGKLKETKSFTVN